MTSIVITRDNTGKLVGAGEKDRAAYSRLKKRLVELEPGECLSLDVWFDRRAALHGWHFILLSAVHDAQEQFANIKDFRMWCATGGGHCTFAPGPTGKMVAIPKSIDWSSLDEEEFQQYHKDVVSFLRSLHATRFLWPQLSDPEASEMIESILTRIEADRKRIVAEREARDDPSQQGAARPGA